MNKAIDEIINDLQRVADRKCYPEDILCGSIAQEWVDYITDLQKENEYSNHCNEELRKKITNLEYKIERLEEDNKQLKELCNKYEEEHNNAFKLWTMKMEEMPDYEERMNYKLRNEKAIEYNYELQERYCHSALFDDLVASKIYEITEKQLNILHGEQNE